MRQNFSLEVPMKVKDVWLDYYLKVRLAIDVAKFG